MSVNTDAENMIIYDQTCKQIWNMKTPSIMAGSVNSLKSSPYQFLNLFRGNLITSKADSSFCVDQAAGSTDAGLMIEIWNCHGGSNQLWIYGMDKTIRSVNGGLCLDVCGGNGGAGTLVDQWYCGSYQQNQMWNYNSAAGGTLSPSYDYSLCLTISEPGNGVFLQLQTCDGGTNQQWNFD